MGSGELPTTRGMQPIRACGACASEGARVARGEPGACSVGSTAWRRVDRRSFPSVLAGDLPPVVGAVELRPCGPGLTKSRAGSEHATNPPRSDRGQITGDEFRCCITSRLALRPAWRRKLSNARPVNVRSVRLGAEPGPLPTRPLFDRLPVVMARR